MADEIKKSENAEPEKAVKKAEKKKDNKPSFIDKAKKFLKEVKSEISKVVWPTTKQVFNNTVVVIVVVLLSAVFIGVIDAIFKFLAGLLAA